MEKNKKAPARAKAVEENYMLTTKLFCGFCDAAMTGVSGTSKQGKNHQYYQCVTNRRKCGCDKKIVKKALIEDKVIDETINLLTPEYIDMLAKSIEKQCEKERNTAELKRIEKLIRENDKATANLIKALEEGKAVDVISMQIEKRQRERADLEVLLAREKIQAPPLSYEQIRFFLERFTGGDVNDFDYRQALVDTFINKIELYEDVMTIYYNAHDGQPSTISLTTKEPVNSGSLKGSPKGRMVELGGVEPPSESDLTQNSPGADGYFGTGDRSLFPYHNASRHAIMV